jgi:hypothetical protein
MTSRNGEADVNNRSTVLMKFYDSIGLPNPDRVRIALAEKGVLDQVEIV